MKGENNKSRENKSRAKTHDTKSHEPNTHEKTSHDKQSNEKKTHATKQTRKQYEQEYNKNNKRVRLTFSNADYAVIETVATKQGLTPASFIRYATLAQAKNLYLFPKEIEEEIKKAVRNMRNIGNNINQIARYTNEQGYSSPDSLETVFNHLLSLENEIKSLREKITEKP